MAIMAPGITPVAGYLAATCGAPGIVPARDIGEGRMSFTNARLRGSEMRLQHLVVMILAMVCTSCSIGSDDATIAVRYAGKTRESTVQSVRLGTAAKAALFGATLSGAASVLIMTFHHAKPAIAVTALADAIALALWAEDVTYRTGAVIARDRGCPHLVGRGDLVNVGQILASTAANRKQEVDELLDSRPMGDKGPIWKLISLAFPTYGVMAAGGASQIASFFSDHGGVWIAAAAATAGAGINSLVLVEVASIAEDYYQEKAKRVCSK